jgi:surface antigen
MLKTISALCAVAALSAGVLATPAMADGCGDNTALATGAGAIGGGAIGAGVSHGSAGGVIGGAIIGALIGNTIARDNCNDRQSDAYYYNNAQYGSVHDGRNKKWRNPNTGASGEIRITRTYNQRGYWDGDNWNESRGPRRNNVRYVQTSCREYTEIVNDHGRRTVTHTACRTEDGNGWRVIR